MAYQQYQLQGDQLHAETQIDRPEVTYSSWKVSTRGTRGLVLLDYIIKLTFSSIKGILLCY